MSYSNLAPLLYFLLKSICLKKSHVKKSVDSLSQVLWVKSDNGG